MNCLPSAVGFTKSLVTKLKSSSMVTQWLTSRNQTSPVFSAVQACRKVSSKPLFSTAEDSACRMRSFDISDAEIQIMSSINLRKSSASFNTSADTSSFDDYRKEWNREIWLWRNHRRICFDKCKESVVLISMSCYSNKKRLDILTFRWNCVFRKQIILDLHTALSNLLYHQN